MSDDDVQDACWLMTMSSRRRRRSCDDKPQDQMCLNRLHYLMKWVMHSSCVVPARYRLHRTTLAHSLVCEWSKRSCIVSERMVHKGAHDWDPLRWIDVTSIVLTVHWKRRVSTVRPSRTCCSDRQGSAWYLGGGRGLSAWCVRGCPVTNWRVVPQQVGGVDRH